MVEESSWYGIEKLIQVLDISDISFFYVRLCCQKWIIFNTGIYFNGIFQIQNCVFLRKIVKNNKE